ncbi:MAG: hypothetical protein Q7S21_01430 [archaeon]|nr:hypothetical protein [archaeon]
MAEEDEEMVMSEGPSPQNSGAVILAIVVLGIIIIGVVVFGNGIGFPDLFGQPAKVLIIGSPSLNLVTVLNENKDLASYVIRSENSLVITPDEILKQYDIVILDQTNQESKEVSRQLGDALKSYVEKGGKLMVILDSGIRSKGASDVIGWEASFGNIMPVKCDRTVGDLPSCTVPISLTGRVFRQDFGHQIMIGIEKAPIETEPPIFATTFAVTPTDGANQIAYIQDEINSSYYPAIVEKGFVLGKVIYFNYDPSLTRQIFTNTIKYLQ